MNCLTTWTKVTSLFKKLQAHIIYIQNHVQQKNSKKVQAKEFMGLVFCTISKEKARESVFL